MLSMVIPLVSLTNRVKRVPAAGEYIWVILTRHFRAMSQSSWDGGQALLGRQVVKFKLQRSPEQMQRRAAGAQLPSGLHNSLPGTVPLLPNEPNPSSASWRRDASKG